MKRDGIVLMERDKNLFRYLYLHKLARITDIQADVFGGVSRQAVQRRVQKLAHARYLECTYLPGTEKKIIYSLGQRAVRDWIGSKETLDRSQTKSNSPFHDLVLLEIMRWLKSKKNVEAVFSENGIRSGLYVDLPDVDGIRSLNSDIAARIRFHEKPILLPLEYERMEKFSHRYDKVIRRYYQNKQVEAVIFICEDSKILKKISYLELKAKPPHKFFYALREKLNTEKTYFKNIDGVTLTIE